MAETMVEAQTLLTGLREEAGLYTTILSLSAEELRLVKEAELEKATGVLSLKQRRLDEIGVIEARIRPMKEKWPEIRVSLPSDSLAQFQGTLKELSDTLERLIALERETEDTLSGQISVVRKGIPIAEAEEKAKKAYGAQKEGKKRE
jgi:hypothetical protein